MLIVLELTEMEQQLAKQNADVLISTSGIKQIKLVDIVVMFPIRIVVSSALLIITNANAKQIQYGIPIVKAVNA